jgi:hypothetical protein
MSGLMGWLTNQGGPPASGPAPHYPTGPPPSTQQALQEAWQRYRAQQGARGVTPQNPFPSWHSAVTPQQQPQQRPAAPASTGAAFAHALHPSSIRVDFHAPPEPQ